MEKDPDVWDRFKAIYEKDPHAFDEAVIEMKEQEAYDINKAGCTEQWGCLMSEGGLKLIEQILEEIEDEGG